MNHTYKAEEREALLRQRVPQERIWECADCHAILGVLTRNKQTLRIKYRDLYLEIQGRVTRRCHQCATMNALADDDYEQYRTTLRTTTIMRVVVAASDDDLL